MGTVEWGREVAEAYDADSAEMFDPGVLGPTVAFLGDLAGDGAALELAIGTGRVALPLSARGIEVHGIELSPHMAAVLRAKPGADRIDVTVGDMATTRLDATFRLVYLVFNTIMNLTTQDEQVRVFENAAAHLEPGGAFVVEVLIPQIRRVAPGELGRVFSLEDDHVGIETFDDLAGQISWSHHWVQDGDTLRRHSAPYRFVWPSELDLMARVAGLRLRERWSSWQRTRFDPNGIGQVVVYEKPR
ncbi:MAG TPA: class I SAM-dependent methyltransferase [Acidimicrobiia bacterium]|jgi:SAM-dependent methyltransferase|nr:class I SAM-dependent methyltransferase [Acidimicrobiia bacterium]